MTKENIKKYIPAILLAVIILLLSAYMVYWGTQKEGYHIDEMFSLMDIRGDGYRRATMRRAFYNVWHTTAELEATVMVAPEDAFSNFGEYPSPHTNLLHAAYSLRPGEFSLWPSLVLNVILLGGSLVVIYLLSLFFIENRYLALLPGLVWGLGSAAVNLVVFIRFYTFKTFICLLLVYLVFTILKKGPGKWGYLIAIAVTMYLGMATHQYFFVFAFFLSALVCLYLLAKRQFKPLLIIIGTAVLALTAFLIITENRLFRVFSATRGRGVEAIENLLYGSDGYFDRIRLFLGIVNEHVFAGMNRYMLILLMAVLIFAIYMASRKDGAGLREMLTEQKTQLWLLMGAVCLLYILLIARIAPYQELRYVFCITPFVVILFISLLVNAMGAIGFKRTGTVFAIVSVLCSGLMISSISDVYIFRGYKSVDEKLRPYYHLPVVCISNTRNDPASCYWQLFEFDGPVLFTRVSIIDMDVISGQSFDNGMLLLQHPALGDSDAQLMAKAVGLSSATRITYLVRHWVYHLS